MAQISGNVIAVLPLQQGVSKTGKQWRKQTYVVETTGQYPRKVAFNVMNDRIDTFGIQQGAFITVEYDPESREYQGKWYTELTAWRCSASQGAVPQGAYPAAPAANQDVYYQNTAPAGYGPAGQGYGPAPAPSSNDMPF